MAKDPAFLFYSQDWIVGCQTLTMQERGQYITIICQMHQQGRMKEETIRLLVGSISDNLKNKFGIDKDGFWFNKRLELEAEKRANFAESRRKNGQQGGRPKSVKKPKRNLTKTDRLATPNHIEDENEIVIEDSKLKNEDAKEKSLHVRFREIFMDKYAKKKGTMFAWGAQAGKHGKHLNGIIDQSRVKVLAKIASPTDDDLCEFWETFLEYLPEWDFKNTFSPAGINSRFNEIFDKINNFKNGINHADLDRKTSEFQKAYGNPYA